MALLAFTLQGAAIAAGIGTLAGLLGLLIPSAFRRRSPAVRADVAALSASLPALAVVAVLVGVAMPSLVGLWDLASDHCMDHGHHAHLCLVHGTVLSPLLAAVGSVTLGVFLFRLGALGRALLVTHAQLRGLERLGELRAGTFPTFVLPGAPRLCHAAGFLRPRILLSASLAEALSDEELPAALAHEMAHLRRGDPLLRLLISLSGLFTLPALARRLRLAYQAAAEEACDAHAVREGSDGTVVAGVLVKVAALQRALPRAGAITACAFGDSSLERRVHLLLSRRNVGGAATKSALAAMTAFGLLAAIVAVVHGSAIHHAVETALHQLF